MPDSFEAQVADAMCTDRYNGQPCRMCQHLAPRVAAAIQVAARDFGQDIASAEQAALRALRGETLKNNFEVGGPA